MAAVLGIETSCDETAAAVVEDGRLIRSNVVASQEALHRQFGGVVPEVASRQHVLTIAPVVRAAMAQAEMTLADLAAVAVSHGPGLAGSLLVGVNAAKGIACGAGLPLVGVNHLEGHLYANWLLKPAPGQDVASAAPASPGAAAARPGAGTAGRVGARRRTPAGAQSTSPLGGPPFPLLCLIVSGGHTELVLMRDHGAYELLGRTRDDAAGEAFDKVARILELGYPGGPAIQRAAAQVRGAPIPAPYRLTRPWLRGTYDFSFSGLKTAVLRLVEGGGAGPVGNPSRLAEVAPVLGRFAAGPVPERTAFLAASFQETVVEVLVGKTCDAAEAYKVKAIALAGGVAANTLLREQIAAATRLPVFRPEVDLCTDNAAMVAAAGYFRLRAGHTAGWDLDVLPNLRLA